MRILIIEDDLMSRTYMQKIVKDLGTIDSAVNGDEGLQSFSKSLDEGKPYDLILLDINMPKKEGQEVLKQIRLTERERGIPDSSRTKVVMTTALSDDENVMQAFENLCEGYLVKPFEKEVVIGQLRALGFDVHYD